MIEGLGVARRQRAVPALQFSAMPDEENVPVLSRAALSSALDVLEDTQRLKALLKAQGFPVKNKREAKAVVAASIKAAKAADRKG